MNKTVRGLIIEELTCIDNTGVTSCLTIGKKYLPRYDSSEITVSIKSDDGYVRYFNINKFKTLSEIRNEKINKLLF